MLERDFDRMFRFFLLVSAFSGAARHRCSRNAEDRRCFRTSYTTRFTTVTLCFDDVHAERAPRVRGVKETPWSMPGVHVAHFGPMCLTAWNSLCPPKRPIMSRTGPTRFDAWSSWGGRPERTLGGHPHVLGRHVVAWSTVYTPCKKGCSGIQKITGGLGSLSIW